MATAPAIDFVGIAPMIAERLLGQPNARLSSATEKRYGSKGSLSVDLTSGMYFDHERKLGGGMLDLIREHRGGDNAAALSWLEDEGLKERATARVIKPMSSASRPTATAYDYRDEQGEVLSRVKRSADKRFFQLAADGAGGFRAEKGCMDGVRRIPYRLPELIAAGADRVVFIVEGEKDADRLADAGLVATCNSEGAGKFRPESAPHFAGRRVVVLPDNDQTGFDHANSVVGLLNGVVRDLTILLLPDLPAKGDVSDWLDAGGTIEQLKTLAARGLENPILRLTTSLEGESSDAQHGDPGISATPYVWIDPQAIPPRPWVLGRWLLRGVVTAAVAPGGIGKSTLLSGVAWSLITAQALVGKQVWDGKKRVWIWNLEDQLHELQRSIQSCALHHGLREADLEGRLFVDTAMEGSGLCTAIEDEAGFKLLEPVYAKITAELIRRKIDLLVIDPFVSSHEVDENANSKIDKIAKAWAKVANAANCSVILVHHTSKAGSGEVTALSARGAKALTDACRATLVLNRMDTETAERFGFDDQERRRYFTVQDDKHNRAPPENADWFRLASVDLGNGGDDGHSDSVGVAVPWSPPDPFEGLSGSHLLRIQKAIDGRDCRENWQSPDWVGRVVAETLGLNPDDKKDRRRIIQMIKAWVANGALVVVERADSGRDKRKYVEVGKWQDDDAAPPETGGARQCASVGAPVCPTTTPPIVAGVGRGGAVSSSPVGRGWSRRETPTGMIFAPGEDSDDVDF